MPADLRHGRCGWMRGVMLAVLGALALAAPCVHAVTPALAAGFDRTCAVDEPGRAYCWGNDGAGALGIGSRILSLAPVAVRGLGSGVAAIVTSPSAYHTCALGTSGELSCWGGNANGQLGDGTVGDGSVPSRARIGPGVTSIATGVAHTCAVRAGTVHCWGNNSLGQLGTGVPRGELLPVALSLTGARAVSAGNFHTCAVTEAGGVSCWGLNETGQLGTGNTTFFPTPTPVTGLTTGVASLASGYDHTCALTTDGRVLCWGDNAFGQLGDGSTAVRTQPVPVSIAGVTIAQVAAGAFHTCALSTTRRLFCWGSNASFQLGRSGGSAPSPVEVAGLPADISAIALGWQHSCAIAGGATMCWGQNALGQLGSNVSGNTATPTAVAGLARPLASISAGTDHTCGIDTGGAAVCWGGNTAFQLGDGQAVGLPRPAAVRGLPSSVTSVATGSFHGCALDAGGGVWCWGGGDQGQLGDGAFHNVSTPVQTRLTAGIAAIASGTGHVCALSAGGAVSCWGANFAGQLGRGTTADSAVPAAPSSLASGVIDVASGFAHACAVMAGGGVRCWGANGTGQLGASPSAGSLVPVAVAGIGAEARAVSLGDGHSCALTAAGGVLCWGANGAGQLGDGRTTDRFAPAPVVGLPPVAKISSGESHVCALTRAGSAWCWGANAEGQLGTGGTENSLVPVPVPGLGDGVADIAAGRLHTCARTTAGIVFCWGHNNAGAAGDSTFAHRGAPAVVVREGGGGTIAGNDWFFDLRPGVAKAVPADKVPAYLVDATGNVVTTVVEVDARLQFRPQDVGTSSATFVFALAPASVVQGAAAEDRLQWKAAGTKSSHVACALAQLNAQGQLVAVSAASLHAYASGVLSAQGQSVRVIDAIPASSIAGATFFVGYGADGSAMLVNGTTRSVVSVPGSVSCRPQPPQTGWWWNPAEGGRGFTIEVKGNLLFMAAFHYDNEGRATWNYAGGPMALDGSMFTSGFLRASGGQTLTGPYAGGPTSATTGPITLAFSDATHGTMIWPGGATPIERLPFVPNGLTTPVPAGVPEAGWWWNSQESGRGFFVEWQNNNAHIAGYMYDAAGNPTWYLSRDPWTDPLRYSGRWQSFGNGQAPTGPYRPAQALNENVGPLTIEFSARDRGTLTLPDGRRIPLERQPF